MKPVTVLEHRGHKIVQTRFAQGTDLNGMRTVLAETGAVYAGLPMGSILALVVFEGQEFDQPEIDLLEAVARANAQAVKATAFLGVSGPQRALFNAMISITGRKGKLFDVEPAALDWLVECAGDADPLAGF
jgi:hypothetical protein